MLNEISGGVCAARGFQAAGVHCGVKASSSPDKNDLALILSERECAAAAVYTLNRVKSAPVYVTMDHLEDGTAWGVVANSGNANACCPLSHENAQAMCAAAAQATGRQPEDFVVRMGAIAKGSGMIHPNMGTMLAFITTDCAITHELLSDALHQVAARTFNRVTVDGDTSTNDTCAVLANGLAGNTLIEWKDGDYEIFVAALDHVCRYLARSIAADGEGCTKLITCLMSGARSEESAERLAKSVVGSSLVKAAMFGADANWGRVLCAMGYSKAPFRPEHVDVTFRSAAGELLVCKQGEAVDFDEAKAKEVLSQKEVIIAVDLHEGEDSAECWGCDLTYDYVKINGDYRT